MVLVKLILNSRENFLKGKEFLSIMMTFMLEVILIKVPVIGKMETKLTLQLMQTP